jgi:pimeloyl-ACP methyl ester carboxylesterase
VEGPVLAHQLVAAAGADREPDRWMLVVHGAFGMGKNFQSFARLLTRAAPRWGLCLVDLRGHGRSQGLPPPHDLRSAAADLARLRAALGKEVRGIAGHSLGGKVALAYLEEHPGELDLAFVLDSDPGARAPTDAPDGAARVLELLASLDPPLASREDFRERLFARGLSRAIVDFLAMNVHRVEPEGARLGLDLAVIRALLADYWARDLWRVVADPRSARKVVLVAGGKSDVFGPRTVERAERLASSAEHVAFAVLPEAGHWLHVDDPAGLCAHMAASMVACEADPSAPRHH